MELISFILASYGMTMIIVYGKIFDKIRPNWELLKCTLCTGFWVGIFNWFIIDLSVGLFTAGCISAGTTYILDKIVSDDGIVIKNK